MPIPPNPMELHLCCHRALHATYCHNVMPRWSKHGESFMIIFIAVSLIIISNFSCSKLACVSLFNWSVFDNETAAVLCKRDTLNMRINLKFTLRKNDFDAFGHPWRLFSALLRWASWKISPCRNQKSIPICMPQLVMESVSSVACLEIGYYQIDDDQ